MDMWLLPIIWFAGMALATWWWPDPVQVPRIFLVAGGVGVTMITIALLGAIVEALLRQRE